MSYRKLNVKGIDFEYVIGKSHVKVKGIGAWPKEEVGERYWHDCGCGEGFDCPDSFEQIQVKPRHVANKIVWENGRQMLKLFV